MGEADFVRQKNKWLAKIFRWIQKNDAGAPIVPFCATFEEQLQSLERDDARADYMNEIGVNKSVRDKVVDAGYETANVIRFYTTLNGAVMVWSAPKGIRAPQAASVVHSDLESMFAGVEVISWTEHSSEDNGAALKQAGKLNRKGKDYVIIDGDIVHFKSHGSPKNKTNSNPGSPMNKPSSNPSTPTHKANSNPSTPVNKPSKLLNSVTSTPSAGSPTVTASSDPVSWHPLDGFQLDD